MEQLRQATTWSSLAAAYEQRFQDKISEEDFRGFLQVLEDKYLLTNTSGFDSLKITPNPLRRRAVEPERKVPRSSGTFLFYRIPLCNPDRFLDWFAQAFAFLWSTPFLIASLGAIAFSVGVMVFNWTAITQSFATALQSQSSLLAPLIIFMSTAIHELGHGATCKRHGGKVKESGFLLMLLIPCLYVNVSDAWMMSDRRKRLAVTLAGGYCDLCNYALAVLIWRVTVTGSLVNQIAFLVMVACGTRALMNFNPFVRMDGYYILTDLLNYPNLYGTGRKYWMGLLSWFFWGAKKPEQPQRWKIALPYGILMWAAGILILNFVGLQLFDLASTKFGIVGMVFASVLLLYGLRRVFKGFIGSEIMTMLRTRVLRTVVWVTGIGLGIALLFNIPMKNYVSGSFEVRSAKHFEVTSPLNGFLAVVHVRDGQMVHTGDLLAELRAPELETQIATKNAELEQSQAILSKLEVGPRREEVAAAEERVRLLRDWVSLGEVELETATKKLDHELLSMEQRCEQVRLQIQLAEEVLKKSEQLYTKGAVTGSQIIKEKSDLAVLRAQLAEVAAQAESRRVEGLRVPIAELARRKQDLSAAENTSSLLKLGTRYEEIEAERAKCRRLEKELTYLKEQQNRQVVKAPAPGIISAPRFTESIGRFLPQGSSLCKIEDPGVPQVEIYVSEDDAATIRQGLPVSLKARSLPYETLYGVVERIAPAADNPSNAVAGQQLKVEQTFVVHCAIETAKDRLLPGMTGFGRISRGDGYLGWIAIQKIHRYIRTEFWW